MLATIRATEKARAARSAPVTIRLSRLERGTTAAISGRMVAAGVVAASEGVSYRLPELYGGDQSTDVAFPVDYPASCRPQAWAAAAPLACLVAVTGLDVDAPTGRLDVPDSVSTRLGPFTLSGVRVGGRDLTVRVTEDGRVGVVPG